MKFCVTLILFLISINIQSLHADFEDARRIHLENTAAMPMLADIDEATLKAIRNRLNDFCDAAVIFIHENGIPFPETLFEDYTYLVEEYPRENFGDFQRNIYVFYFNVVEWMAQVVLLYDIGNLPNYEVLQPGPDAPEPLYVMRFQDLRGAPAAGPSPL